MIGRSVSKLGIAVSSAFKALADPTRQDMVAALGETTGAMILPRLRDRMLLDKTGRRILRERPTISSVKMNLERLRTLPYGTVGKAYVDFLDANDITPDSRTEVKYLEDEELAYVMLRYRQVHDFFHVLTGLGISVEEELAVKWFEFSQSGLPVALLSGVVGPLRLKANAREQLVSKLVPWAVQVGAQSKFIMNVYYEERLEDNLGDLRKEMGITPAPEFEKFEN